MLDQSIRVVVGKIETLERKVDQKVGDLERKVGDLERKVDQKFGEFDRKIGELGHKVDRNTEGLLKVRRMTTKVSDHVLLCF